LLPGDYSDVAVFTTNTYNIPTFEIPVTLRAYGAVITVDPEAISETVRKHKMHYDTITVCNDGNKTLHITGVSLSGLCACTIFKTLMADIEPGMCDIIILELDSHDAGEGTHSATLTIDSENDNYNHTVSIPITYLVTGSDLVPDPVSFDVCLVTGTTMTKTLNIKNDGDDVLEWSLSEDNASTPGEWALWLTEDIMGGTLAAGEDVDVTLTFDATADMQLLPCTDYTVDIIISSNDQDNYTFTIPVTMSVGEPDLYLNTTALSFGPYQPCNDEGGCKTFYIQNEGCGCEDLIIHSITEDPEASWLTVTPTEFTLAQFQDQVVEVCVEADELEAGEYTTDLVIDSNDPDGEAVVTVTMTVHAAWVDVMPKAFNIPVSFGKEVDTFLVACNTGDKPSFWHIQLDTPVPWLSFEPDTGTVFPEECDTIFITFDAEGLDPGFTATRYLVYDAYDDHCSPKDLIPVTITVYAPDIVVVPECFYLTLGWEESMDTTLTICNNGLAELNIHEIFTGGSCWLEVATIDTALFKGDCFDHLVHVYTGMLPCEIGEYDDTITIVSNDPDENPFKVCVHLDVVGPTICVTTDGIDTTGVFGELFCVEGVLGICNTGNRDLDWLITESPYVSWLGIDPITGTTAPGDTFFVDVCFDGAELPVEDGTQSTNIVITSNDPCMMTMSVAVSFTTTSSKAVVTPGNVNIGMNTGESMDKTFQIQNTTEDILHWTLVCRDAIEWLEYPEAGAVNPGATQDITLRVDASNLANGTYKTTLTLNTPENTQDIPVELIVNLKGVESEGLPEIGNCEVVYLSNNLPNPFATKTSFVYGVPGRTHVAMKVYDCTGKEVKTLVDGTVDSGYYKVSWDGTDTYGNKLVSGIYFYRMAADGETLTKKLILLR
jgi:hypothetical protein